MRYGDQHVPGYSIYNFIIRTVPVLPSMFREKITVQVVITKLDSTVQYSTGLLVSSKH